MERTRSRKGVKAEETAYAITSLTPEKVEARKLLEVWRGHWKIENRVHWVRDVTFDEDRSQVRTGAAPQVMVPIAIGTEPGNRAGAPDWSY